MTCNKRLDSFSLLEHDQKVRRYRRLVTKSDFGGSHIGTFPLTRRPL